MIRPKLRSLHSPDLRRDALPENPRDCAVFVQADIGSDGSEGSEIFAFTVVTPTYLRQKREAMWGRGYLLVPEFSWSAVEGALHKLLSHASRHTWKEVASELNKELQWEFDNYRE